MDNQAKKVLILAYDFPPYVSVGGLRPYSWFKYLHEFGVYPIVVTRQWSNKYGTHLDYISPGTSDEIIIEETSEGTLIKTPYKPNLANRIMLKYGDSKHRFIRKLISAFYEFAQFIFLCGPKVSIFFTAKKYLEKNKIDLIIASGDPFVLFNYASKLSAEYDIPWVADYRDPWSGKRQIQKNHFLRLWYSYFEKKIIKTASLIITVSSFLQFQILEIIKNQDFFILPNGYDPESLKSAENITPSNDHLTIAFAGTIYKYHPIKNFLHVISKFNKNTKNAKLKVYFYGINNESELKQMISAEFPDLNNNIIFNPKMQNQALLQELSRHNLMLLFNDYSIIGTKIFDYIGIKRNILLCYSNDKQANNLKSKYYGVEEIKGISNHLQEDLVKKTNSGYVIQDSEHLMKVLKDLHEEFKKNGTIVCNTINAEDYSRKEQVKKLAELIKRISKTV